MCEPGRGSRGAEGDCVLTERMEEREKKRGGGGKCKQKGKAGALKENRARTRGLAPQPRFQTRIPKEAGVGVGVGLTIAEKL